MVHDWFLWMVPLAFLLLRNHSSSPETKKRNRIPKFKMTHRIVVSKTSLHTRVIPHHSGAHRSDTPTLLHSFGRHPIPPRAYTLHQERSKQQGKRRERRPAEIVPRRANQSTAATEEVKSVVFCFFGSSSKKKQEFTH